MQQREFMYWLKGYLDRNTESNDMSLKQIIDISQQAKTVRPPAIETAESLTEKTFIDFTRQKLHEAVIFRATPTNQPRAHYAKLHKALNGALSEAFNATDTQPAATQTPNPPCNRRRNTL